MNPDFAQGRVKLHSNEAVSICRYLFELSVSVYIGGFLMGVKTASVMPPLGSFLLYMEELEDNMLADLAVLLLCIIK